MDSHARQEFFSAVMTFISTRWGLALLQGSKKLHILVNLQNLIF